MYKYRIIFANLIASLVDKKHFNIDKVEQQIDEAQATAIALGRETQQKAAKVRKIVQAAEEVTTAGDLTPKAQRDVQRLISQFNA